MIGNNLKQIRIRKAYQENPNRCLECGGPIQAKPGVKLAYTKRQKFCGQSCNTKHQNRIAPKRKRTPRTCGSCGVAFDSKNPRKLCPACREAYFNRLASKTKAEVTGREIRNHAISVVRGHKKQCRKCNYDLFVDICHIRPVSDFPESATVAEINDTANLIKLCPNCHHELDAGLISVVDCIISPGGPALTPGS